MRTRIIAKLDVKPPFVVKPVHFEGLRKIGLPANLAKKYYEQGADEVMYIDIVASLYQREILFSEIEQTANELFIPFGVGGGVKTIDDFSRLFHAGADKVVINTYAVQENPNIINQAAEIFGNQAIVVNIEAKRWDNGWECYTDCGRIQSGKDVIAWAKEVEQRGAGEILLQSVDYDGRQRGFDLELAKCVVEAVTIPVVVTSGAGKLEEIKELIDYAAPSGVAIASLLHYDKYTIQDIKAYLRNNGIEVSK
ncbi:MAG: imidazole glycerol phosphate synthase subunit HisF [Sulfuricurvum sp. GWF2_44_89]|uniref:imidazole glycerol-phosphate synthase n=1 Tax=Sulfuricurvum kujiense TaxID=148813 RepID=A0A2D3WIP7_9BACT|nr:MULTISPECIES: imidazole glycerol phosphate synthase cyclase subunit [Sulfuricurvum]OHD77592.1 MAG: imidazole glycerol phosphate synthase subunit HisF [Sulfuricurvum sp. GWF2_44_89]OHD90346.1 MAG: imidazole glycerol phosphate synthase subunit HisF [Sulfuricurvum sp. RIFOXYD12_FULL_44_77]OHD92336.1 MAG: imidazole glycerol phosphate synthase subunit HisF [Sulfuricurvum sp. RIFOXYD2_FULL_44_160]DAB37594.1 MAG TPA: imidazole glycerol phosphate synthase subunit HisF [Sulfuricurvum kujiense]